MAATTNSNKRTERKSAAHFLVEGVNLGDGKPVRCWLRVSPKGVEVRRYRSPRAAWLPLARAVGVLARAAQVRAAEERLGAAPRDPSPDAPSRS